MVKLLQQLLLMAKKNNMKSILSTFFIFFSVLCFSQNKYVKPNINIIGSREIIELNGIAYINSCLKIWSPQRTDSLFSHKLVNGDYNYGISRRWEEPVNVCLIYGNEWRLPTIEELELIDKSVIKNHNLKNFGSEYFLSSTTSIKDAFPYEGDYKDMKTYTRKFGYGNDEVYHEHFGRRNSEIRYKVVCVKSL